MQRRPQADSLTSQFEALEAGVDGAFVWTFTFPLAAHDGDARHDLESTASRS